MPPRTGYIPGLTLPFEDMAKTPARRQSSPSLPTPFDEARDELFQHIMQCGVIGSDEAHQREWFDETMAYLADRFHELSPEQVKQIRVLGERFVQPPRQNRSGEAVGAA